MGSIQERRATLNNSLIYLYALLLFFNTSKLFPLLCLAEYFVVHLPQCMSCRKDLLPVQRLYIGQRENNLRKNEYDIWSTQSSIGTPFQGPFCVYCRIGLNTLRLNITICFYYGSSIRSLLNNGLSGRIVSFKCGIIHCAAGRCYHEYHKRRITKERLVPATSGAIPVTLVYRRIEIATT